MERKSKRIGFLEKLHSIRTAIISSYFLIVVVSLAVFALVALGYTERTVMENAEEYSIQLIEQVNSDIDSYMNYLHNISALITSDGDVQDYLFGDGLSGREREERFSRITTQFETIMDTRGDIVNIGIIGNERYIINNGSYRVNKNVELEELDWIRKAYDKQGITSGIIGENKKIEAVKIVGKNIKKLLHFIVLSAKILNVRLVKA